MKDERVKYLVREELRVLRIDGVLNVIKRLNGNKVDSLGVEYDDWWVYEIEVLSGKNVYKGFVIIECMDDIEGEIVNVYVRRIR